MKHIKGIGAFLVVVAAIVYKFELVLSKLNSLLTLARPILVAIHLSSALDSATVVSKPHTAGKSPHQVAQNVTPKTNGAAKVVGAMAPVQSGSPSIMPSAPLGAGPIQAARNAAAAQNAQLAKETGQAVPGAPTPTAHPAPAPASTPKQAPTSNQSTAVVQQGTAKPATTTAANSSLDAPVMRESFDYTRDTRRDPFVSLMTTSDLRPTLSDLHLTGILYDLSGRRPVAILRDVAGGQWRVTTGMTLGRMRVAQIKPKTIIFTIEEFGFNRQDSLVLGDTTRVRHR
jgi:hypothetical protein